MNEFLYTLPKNAARVFAGRNLIWHGIAIASTYLLVVSGFDWRYYEAMRGLFVVFIFAGALGFFLPFVFPLVLYGIGVVRKNVRVIRSAYAVAQASLVAFVVSVFYKAFTGRAHPDPFMGGTPIDITHEFHFGFLQRGVFWGWPSSHTMVAAAIAATIWVLYPANRMMRALAILCALYVGVGVSATIHWFSDFVAGVLLGTLVGVIVGNSFSEQPR